MQRAGDRLVLIPPRPDELVKLLVDSVDEVALFMLDPTGLVSTWNRGAERLTGWSADEMLGCPHALLYPREDADAGVPVEQLRRAATDGRAHREGWLLRKGGQRVWTSMAITPVYDDSDLLLGFALLTRDLTAEVDRRSAEERFRLLVESTQDYAIYMLDCDGRVSSWNPGAERLKGYLADEIIGRHFSLFYLPDDAARGLPQEELEQATRHGRYESEGWRVRKDGTRFWANALITAVRRPDGSLGGFAKITRDLTERKRAEARLAEAERARGHAEEARQRSELLADLGRTLSRTLSVEAMLDGVARVAVEWLADYCIVDLRDGDGRLLRSSFAHVDPTHEPLLHELRELLPPDDAASPVGRVFTDGRSELAHHARLDLEHFPTKLASVLRQLDPKAHIIVPLTAHGRRIGTVSLISCDSDRHYGENVVLLAEDFAQRAALALDSARLYEAAEAARDAAEDLQRRLAAVLQQMPSGVLIVDQSGREILANAQHEKLLGPFTSLDALADGAATRAFDEAGRQLAVAELPIARALRGGEVVAGDEVRMVRRDGSQIWLHITAAPIRDRSGQIIGAISSLTDVTARRRLDRSIRVLARAGDLLASSLDQKQTLGNLARMVVPSLGDWCSLTLLSEDGQAIERVALAHADADKLRVAEELSTRYPIDLNSAMGVPQVIRSGQPILYEHVTDDVIDRYCSDPEQRELLRRVGMTSVLMVPIMANGRSIGAMTLVTAESGHRFTNDDVTLAGELARRAGVAIENARLYRDARAAEQAAVRAVSMRDEFISIASHELRTPLTTLRIQAEGLERQLKRDPQLPTEKVQNKLGVVVKQIDRLEELVRALLDVSRLSLGRLEFQPEPFDLSLLATEVVERFQDQASRAACELRVAATGPVLGTWDRLRVEQVLTNLLTNALKYGRGRPVVVEVENAGRLARLTVRDAGIGIAEEDQARIFERFERAVSERNFGGLGLGLFITRELVRGMGGRIGVESRLGEGAAFKVELPR